MIFIIPLVVERIAAERHIADGKVKKAVRQLGILKPLHRDAALLVQLLGDAAGEGVQLHAVQAAVLHALRHQPKKVANAAGRLYVPTDFDTKEKALSGAKAAEKGLK